MMERTLIRFINCVWPCKCVTLSVFKETKSVFSDICCWLGAAVYTVMFPTLLELFCFKIWNILPLKPQQIRRSSASLILVKTKFVFSHVLDELEINLFALLNVDEIHLFTLFNENEIPLSTRISLCWKKRRSLAFFSLPDDDHSRGAASSPDRLPSQRDGWAKAARAARGRAGHSGKMWAKLGRSCWGKLLGKWIQRGWNSCGQRAEPRGATSQRGVREGKERSDNGGAKWLGRRRAADPELMN